MEKLCKNCQCFDPIRKGGGVCKARAPQPQIVKLPKGEYVTVFPPVDLNSGCEHDFVEAKFENMIRPGVSEESDGDTVV